MSNLIRDQFTGHLKNLQNQICSTLEAIDGKARFRSDLWERPGGGGGDTRVISNGDVFEKGGVNSAIVHGKLSPQAAHQLKTEGDNFFACGVSLVLHPYNPFVPTVHANWRYFEVLNSEGNILDAWFGGGCDLTPYYLDEEDIGHFHSIQKQSCDEFDKSLYPTFKKECDNYFLNSHRNNERRGVGGIFFDHCRGEGDRPLSFWHEFTKKNGLVFLDAYTPIVDRQRNTPFTETHKYWQGIRRGRYVEFNLLHDRGTLFGIHTQGRTESILMSLPPTVRFDYDYLPVPGSEEEKLLHVLQKPKDWLTE